MDYARILLRGTLSKLCVTEFCHLDVILFPRNSVAYNSAEHRIRYCGIPQNTKFQTLEFHRNSVTIIAMEFEKRTIYWNSVLRNYAGHQEYKHEDLTCRFPIYSYMEAVS